MFTHPAITQALASQHRRDLITQADACRLARAARDSQPTRPGRSSQPRRLTGPMRAIRRAATTTAAAAAAAVLMMTPAGAATTYHFRAHHFDAHVFSVPSWSHSWGGLRGDRWA